MYSQRQLIKCINIVIILLCATNGNTDKTDALDNFFNQIRPGRYVPQLHGADRGKYVRDDSGRYHHIFIPYNGGYGDTGLKYEHQEPPRPLMLGPRDHLRFMIDFNYNDNGWQIIQFDWIRDGDKERQYKYVNENRLWDGDGSKSYQRNESKDDDDDDDDDDASGGGGGGGIDDESENDDNTNVHVEGDYDADKHKLISTNKQTLTEGDPIKIQSAISEVLDYIQSNILPTLT